MSFPRRTSDLEFGGLSLSQEARRVPRRRVSVSQIHADAIRLPGKGIRGAVYIMRNNERESNSQNASCKTVSLSLTGSEIELLAYVAAGITDEEIAEKLDISISTVETLLSNVFKKIGVPNRLQAALWVAKNLG